MGIFKSIASAFARNDHSPVQMARPQFVGIRAGACRPAVRTKPVAWYKSRKYFKP
jgi:hypothetical protein